MKLVAGLLVCVMMMAALAGGVGAEEDDTCAVLFDFGNGRVVWADVPVEEGMNAFNVTVAAAEELGLDLQYSESSYGIMVGPIEGLDYNPATGAYWGLWIWNATAGAWESSMVGAADIPADSTDAVAWTYSPFGAPAPIAIPEHRYPWTSFRYDDFNTGMQETDIINATLAWSKDLGNGAIDSAIVGANGLLYVITGGILNYTDFSYDTNSALFCLNATGAVVWSAEIGAGYQVGSPLLFGNMVIVPSADGKLYAFDAADGDVEWTYDTGSAATNGITSSPVAYTDSMMTSKIVFAAGNGVLYSVYAGNGTLDWSVEVADKIYSSSPAILNGIIYIGDDSGNVSAFAADGSGKLWSTEVGEKVRGSPVLDVARNQVVVAATGANGNITALNMTTGAVMWQTVIGGSSASVAMASNGFVAATASGLFMVDFDGQKLWDLDLGTSFGGAAPTVVGETIYAVTNEAASRLVAVSLDGELLWDDVLEPANYALSAPTVIDGVLYVAADNGHVYAFASSTGVTDPSEEGPTPEEFPWLLVGGIVAILIVVAVGLVYWNGKKGKR